MKILKTSNFKKLSELGQDVIPLAQQAYNLYLEDDTLGFDDIISILEQMNGPIDESIKLEMKQKLLSIMKENYDGALDSPTRQHTSFDRESPNYWK